MVGDAFNIALGFLILIVGTWVLIFGGIGLMLARSLGQNAVLGFALGTILGPIGWLAIWLMARYGGLPGASGAVDHRNHRRSNQADPEIDNDLEDWFGPGASGG